MGTHPQMHPGHQLSVSCRPTHRQANSAQALSHLMAKHQSKDPRYNQMAHTGRQASRAPAAAGACGGVIIRGRGAWPAQRGALSPIQKQQAQHRAQPAPREPSLGPRSQQGPWR